MATSTVTTTKLPWQEIALTVQKRRDESIAHVKPPVPDVPADLPRNVTGIPKKLLTEREVEITETAPEQLITSLAAGKLTATEVTNAFLRRAGLAQKLVNCVTDLLPERSLARANYLDEYYAKNKKPIGPLHGIPISVKEYVGMKGLDTNAGFVSWVGKTQDDDANILKILWDAGAVFHARTTQPQTLMHLESSTNLYGATVNPYNTTLTAGGSSGGEGALIGIRGSCLGIGTDIGGSIRSPAANNGLYGLRPTSYRLPLRGCVSPMPGSEHIVAVIGPLSTTLEGVKVFMKTIIDTKPWLIEPSLLPFEWKPPPPIKKLKVAILWSDGVVKPHPPIIRALKDVAEKLKSAGVEVVDWKPYKHDLAWEIIASLYFSDGGALEASAIDASSEPWRPLSTFILKENPHVSTHTIHTLWQQTSQREKYRADYAALWNSTATGTDIEGQPTGMVDVILCPTGPGAAPPLDCARYWGYTSQWNLLDYPSLVFPHSQVDPTVDVKEDGYKPLNEQDEYNYNLYEPELYRDAPVSLQLVARRYEDEKVIAAAEYILSKTGPPKV
ncbi:MAG: hypothetical protein M1819_005220 [Sarea resinae]|nr:MAG: hypothetical protein M1819_005220 [Sarea resinae]